MSKTAPKKILIIDEMHPSLLQKLEAQGLSYDYEPWINAEEVEERLKGYSVLVLRSKMRVKAGIKNVASALELIVRAGSGMDNLDVEGLNKNGIRCVNCPEGNRDAVAEHTMGMLLSLSSNIVKGHNETSRHIWDREGNRGFEIMGKTVGIIGFGNTGTAVAKRLMGFGVRVLAYDKYLSGFGNENVEEVDLDTIYDEADVISFHLPLTRETRNWIDEDFFKRLKKRVVLLNLSRGEIMDAKALLNALENDVILAAGLDVWTNEKLASWNVEEKRIFNAVKGFENVVLTPHVGGWSTESYRRISEIAADKILAHFEKSYPFVKDEDNISDNT